MTIVANNGGNLLTLVGQNVNELFGVAVPYLLTCERQRSRAGDVVAAPFPVMSIYYRPMERVLFCPQRDANPFFHFFEALWMLNGDHDAAFLNRYVRDFGDRFAEEDGHLHGAYGYRWRHSFQIDQLDVAVARLKKNPVDRRVVIAMWNPEDDCLELDLINDDTGLPYAEPKDLPCNTHIYLRIVDGKLELTVMCRSNDVVWGVYGANAVHFSMLQEYLAGRIGVPVGRMYQFSNNWHGYIDVITKMNLYNKQIRFENLYNVQSVEPTRPRPMGTVWDKWDEDLRAFMQWARTTDAKDGVDVPSHTFANPWFKEVAVPMFFAHGCIKGVSQSDALEVTPSILATDWRLAAEQWIQRRIDRSAGK